MVMVGFLIIFAKFSDIFGAKFMLLLALLIFTVFSIACGAATAMTELYSSLFLNPTLSRLGLTVNQTASSSAPSKESAVQESTPWSAS
jgi:MFS family permease